MPYKDPKRRAEYQAEWWRLNRSRHLGYVSNWEQKQLEFMRSLRVECVRCGENHPATLDFHHRDASEKDLNLAEAVRRFGWGKKKILEEVAKCDVLCSNCHRILHFSERGMKPGSGTDIPSESHKLGIAGPTPACAASLKLALRSVVGRLPLEQHTWVRFPESQPGLPGDGRVANCARLWSEKVVGSNPTPPAKFRGCSSTVECCLARAKTTVRICSPAPFRRCSLDGRAPHS
jgi:hypothetical protein